MEMSNKCWTLSGLFLLVAGILLLFFGLGKINGATAHLWAGILIGVYGLGLIMHSAKMCPKCK